MLSAHTVVFEPAHDAAVAMSMSMSVATATVVAMTAA